MLVCAAKWLIARIEINHWHSSHRDSLVDIQTLIWAPFWRSHSATRACPCCCGSRRNLGLGEALQSIGDAGLLIDLVLQTDQSISVTVLVLLLDQVR